MTRVTGLHVSLEVTGEQLAALSVKERGFVETTRERARELGVAEVEAFGGGVRWEGVPGQEWDTLATFVEGELAALGFTSDGRRVRGAGVTTRRDAWVSWLESYGAAALYDALVANAQGAEGRCVHCRRSIYLDVVEGGGVPDWGSLTVGGLDYGCDASPDTDEGGSGGHVPRKLEVLS